MKPSHTRLIVIAGLVLLFFMPFAVFAAGPMDTLKVPVNEVINILNDPQFKDMAQHPELKKVQRDKIWEQTQKIFDFEIIAKSVVGNRYHWNNSFSPEQREAFIDVLSRLIGNFYIDKIQQGYENGTVTFVSEEIEDSGKKAKVDTVITQDNTEIPVVYWMRNLKSKNEWVVFDVHISGVSMIAYYRDQLVGPILNKGDENVAAQLIDEIKAKLNE